MSVATKFSQSERANDGRKNGLLKTFQNKLTIYGVQAYITDSI
jgi:hypothetical protein